MGSGQNCLKFPPISRYQGKMICESMVRRLMVLQLELNAHNSVATLPFDEEQNIDSLSFRLVLLQ
jgi:hypothetical protein